MRGSRLIPIRVSGIIHDKCGNDRAESGDLRGVARHLTPERNGGVVVGNAKITRLKIIHRVSNSIQTRFPF